MSHKMSLPRSAPEAQGVRSNQVRLFVEAVDQKVRTLHSFMLVRYGKVVAEGWWKPQTPDTPHVLHSLSKSFTSTAIGIAISEGRLGLHDCVLDYFPEYAPENPSDNLKSMRVQDLLCMSTGHESEPNARSAEKIPWAKTFLANPVPFKPGTHFLYNSVATYMLSAIIQKVTGEKLVDYLTPRLFDPLGIDKPKWDECPDGINTGGWGLYLRTEDIAKFGQLYLQQGIWNGRELAPAAWIRLATSKQASNGSNPLSDWDQGYGFQFWMCRNRAYRGDGMNGQFCIVLPDQDAIIAITADTPDMQGVLDIVWEYLLPAFAYCALPENAAANDELKTVLSGLTTERK
jgi:CubicO group peptidase (beta-lactamase class C family)